MTKEEFTSGIEKLLIVFHNHQMTAEAINLYYEYTKHIDRDDWFKYIITPIIQKEKFFPAIATLLALKPQLETIPPVKELERLRKLELEQEARDYNESMTLQSTGGANS